MAAALVAAALAPASLFAAPAVASRPSLPPGQPADDETTPLAPRRPRTEAEEDRVHSLGLYAAARMADRASNYSVAMNLYARAFRYDKNNVEALQRAQILAHLMGRHTLSARYASQLVTHDTTLPNTPVEPLDLLRGMIYLRQEGRVGDALAAYEKSLANRRSAKSPAWVELHKQAGELYLQEKKYPAAADAFTRVSEAFELPEAHGLDKETLKLIRGDADLLDAAMIDAYLKAGRVEAAERLIESLAKTATDEGQTLYNRARLAAARNKHDQALASLDVYLDKKLTSQGEGPYQLLCEVLVAQGQAPQRPIRLQAAVARQGDNAALGNFLAAHYLAEERWAEARALYASLLERKPTSAGHQGLISALRRLASKEHAEVAGLLTALGGAVRSTGGLNVLGSDLEAIARDAELMGKLAAEGDRRWQENPASLKGGERLALALLQSEARQFAAAGRWFDLAIQAEPDQKGTYLTTWGLALIAGEQYAAAVDVLQRAFDERAVSADNPVVNYYLAGALSMVKRHDAALVAALKAAATDAPAELATRVGWAQYRAGRYDEAQAAYRELLKRFDGVHDTPGVREAVREARLTLSHVCVLKGDMPQAEELLEQVLDEFPDNVGVRNDLGYLWADQGKHLKRSLEMIQQAVAAEPENAAYRDSLGWALFRLGRNEEAVAELKRAAGGGKPDGVVLDHLGDALEKAGRYEEALAAWKRALDSFADDDPAKKKATEEKIRRAEQAVSKE